MKKSELVDALVLVAIGGVVLAFVLSLIPAAIWYCFDDKLAEIAGVPALGRVPFWNMYAFCIFVMWLFKGRGVTVSKK